MRINLGNHNLHGQVEFWLEDHFRFLHDQMGMDVYTSCGNRIRKNLENNLYAYVDLLFHSLDHQLIKDMRLINENANGNNPSILSGKEVDV